MRRCHVLAALLLISAPTTGQAQASQPLPTLHQGDPVEVLFPRFGSGWIPARIEMVGQCPMVVVRQDPANRYVAPNRPKEIRAYSLVVLQGLRIRASEADSSWVTLSEEDLQQYGACPAP